MDNTDIAKRMKNYEAVSKTKLLRRTPVIIRLDGKSFHTWTKQLKYIDDDIKYDPYGEIMHDAMSDTAQYLMDNIQNAVFAYSQSDEISILLNDWKKLNTDQWFDGNVQKIASVSASMATAAFNDSTSEDLSSAMFDSRVFNIPKEEVANYFIWRQQDASRNSVQMLGQFHFSHKELHCKNISTIQDMLMSEHNVNWNDVATRKKRGFCVTLDDYYDTEIPIFTKDRNYIEKYLNSEED